jgi:Ca2+-binding EF-hand superfamily protein
MISLFDETGTLEIGPRDFDQLWSYLSQWKGCFDSFDRDRSNSISEAELSSAFSTMGYRFNPSFVALVMQKYDSDRNGTIGFDEYIQVHCLHFALKYRNIPPRFFAS